MLIIALVLAVIGLAALVTAVVTSNELIAWVCIGASVIGVVLLIVDAVRERSAGDGDDAIERDDDATTIQPAEDYPDEPEADTPQPTEDEAIVAPRSSSADDESSSATEAEKPN